MRGSAIDSGAWLGSPAMPMPAVLGRYNDAWFGSVLESGYRYQRVVVNLQERYAEISWPIFALPNLDNYLRDLVLTGEGFPSSFPKYGGLL